MMITVRYYRAAKVAVFREAPDYGITFMIDESNVIVSVYRLIKSDKWVSIEHKARTIFGRYVCISEHSSLW